MKTYCEETHCQMWKGTLKELDKRQAEHDKQIKAEVIEDVDKFIKSFPSLLCHTTVMEEWENFKKLKEQNK